MNEIDSYGRGLWPSRYSKHEVASLKVQSTYDRRNIPLKWYWRLITMDEAGGLAPEETYYETPDIYRKYDGPHGVHLFVDDTAKTKAKERGTIETTGEIVLAISRVECRRLGALFGVTDDRDALLLDEEQASHDDGPFKGREPLFIPRAGDVFMFRRKHHRVEQMSPDYEQSLGPQGTVMAWKGTASMIRMDANQPLVNQPQLVPPTSDPVVPRLGRDVACP